MGTSSRWRRLGAASLTASIAAVTLFSGTASAVDRSQPTQDRNGDRVADLGSLRLEASGDITWSWSGYERWGNINTDLPMLGDFDGDGRDDAAVYRPGTPSTWYIKGARPTNVQRAVQFGDDAKHDTPVHGDFDGDGKADLAVVRPPTDAYGELADGPLTWYIARSSGGTSVLTYGNASDIPVPANYVGGAASDLAVRRLEADGTTAVYIRNAAGGTDRVAWGNHEDEVVLGDYDGDGRSDISVVRAVPFDPAAPDGPALLRWFIRLSAGGAAVVDFGNADDVPVFADYTGDGRTDISIVRYPEPPAGYSGRLESYVRDSRTGSSSGFTQFGDTKHLPLSYAYSALLNTSPLSRARPDR